MDPLAVAGLIVGVIGTACAIAVAVRGKQLSRPRLKLTIGVPPVDRTLPRAILRAPFTTLVIGSPSPTRPNLISIPFFLHNATNTPITDLTLRIEYSAQHLLTDGLRISDDAKGRAVIIDMNSASKREAVRVFDKAYVSYDLGVLRPHETAVVSEFMALHPLPEAGVKSARMSDQRIERASRRFAGLSDFQSFFVLDVITHSSNCASFTASVNVIWSTAKSITSLADQGGQYISKAWDGKKPKPGLYFNLLRPLTKTCREERFWFMFIEEEKDAFPESPQQLAERLLGASTAVAVVYSPPWGLTGESFGLTSRLGMRVSG